MPNASAAPCLVMCWAQLGALPGLEKVEEVQRASQRSTTLPLVARPYLLVRSEGQEQALRKTRNGS